MKIIMDSFNVTLIGQSEFYIEQKEAWGKFLVTCPNCKTQSWKEEIIESDCTKCNHELQIDYCHKDDGGIYRMHRHGDKK